ncbi:MAG TPA: HlyC/CorC family transporter [bacterium (Candidatus Stahlbacteria)]|nr:HlyC/CorC family transporter [Candidatus Stahlbacteria bacterium]
MYYLFQFVGLILLLLLSAFFSCSETAIFSLPKITIEKIITQRGKKFSILLSRERLLSTILFGNTLVNVGASALAVTILYQFINGRITPIGMTAITLGMTFVVLVFGEFTPKFYAIENSEPISIRATPILAFFRYLFLPLTFMLEGLSSIIRAKASSSLTLEELRWMIESSKEEGYLNSREAHFIAKILDFRKKTVKEIMTPRIKMEAISDSYKVGEIISKKFVHSRIPVYREKVDEIVGILYIKDLLLHSKDKESSIVDIVREPFFVPETMKLDTLFSQFQTKRIHMAVVVDEYGGLSGIVTLDDILESVLVI